MGWGASEPKQTVGELRRSTPPSAGDVLCQRRANRKTEENASMALVKGYDSPVERNVTLKIQRKEFSEKDVPLKPEENVRKLVAGTLGLSERERNVKGKSQGKSRTKMVRAGGGA